MEIMTTKGRKEKDMTLDEKLEEMRKASQNSESKQDLGESSQDSKCPKCGGMGRWLVVYKRM